MNQIFESFLEHDVSNCCDSEHGIMNAIDRTIAFSRASGEQSSGKMMSPSQSPTPPPPMRCIRGHSYYIVRTSKIERNPRRKFYTCKDAKCNFFMWCDEVQNFVDSQLTCGKDEKVKNLENRVARLEDELRDLNYLVPSSLYAKDKSDVVPLEILGLMQPL
ncbi:hypothetical protein Taro_032695 [Colocasia esculenta]|uniref:GRF-type domain-containing protein n=1 Tax=Colocasia esculenta TaxID=4460 RepID=A0A843VLY6_COLES|nr:hypothetical protein [Colocasia esculenta]